MTKAELIALLLTYFLKAKPSRMIHTKAGFESYAQAEIKHAIYALDNLGFIKKAYGEKSGSVYFTTQAGREYLGTRELT